MHSQYITHLIDYLDSTTRRLQQVQQDAKDWGTTGHLMIRIMSEYKDTLRKDEDRKDVTNQILRIKNSLEKLEDATGCME